MGRSGQAWEAAPIDLSGREPCVDLGKRNGAAEMAKCSMIRDLRCRLEETGKRGAGQRPADANPPDAQPAKFGYAGEIAPDQNVHRFRRDGTDHRRDITRRAYPRRVEAFRASLRIRGQAADRLGNVRPPDDEALRTRGQSTPVPVASMAWRAARMRSTDRENSKSGFA
jgi:hypothetical protein